MKTKLRAIEHRAISGVWLLGEDFEDITISEETYSWLWSNIYTICDSPRLVKMFWANSSQYYDFRLQAVFPDYDQSGNLINRIQVDKRNEERNRFLEFHYALGGLLLYRKQYKTLNYLFEYSQSQPPKYPLLPETMTEIFYWFENFRNEFKHRITPIEYRYSFPELDNLGSRRQIIYWICSYVVILFFRQYSLNQYYVFQDFTALPNLPDDVIELSSWLDSVSYFEWCINNVITNEQLIADLEFEKVIGIHRDSFSQFINDLKENIKSKIGQQKLNANLSEDKIESFYSKSNEIISKAFEVYQPIFIEKDEAHSNSELKLSIRGESTLMSKSALTDRDVPHLNYDTFFGDMIATHNIKRYIPNAFFIARTKRYLLNKDNILLGLDKIIGNNDDIIIIGIRISYKLQKILDGSRFTDRIRYIPSTESFSHDTLFVLHGNDLPALEHKELNDPEKTELQLTCINEDLKLYASVIDINTKQNESIKDKWKDELVNEDPKVQLSISFLSVIYWKNKREIIQLSIASEFKEQGIQNHINDVESLMTEDKK